LDNSHKVSTLNQKSYLDFNKFIELSHTLSQSLRPMVPSHIWKKTQISHRFYFVTSFFVHVSNHTIFRFNCHPQAELKIPDYFERITELDPHGTNILWL
jgi:hypothetical protein